MTADEIREQLKQVKYPGFSRDIVSFGIVREIEVDERRTQVRLFLATENEDVVRQIVEEVEAVLGRIEGLAPADIIVERPRPQQGPGEAARALGRGPSRIEGASRVLAVASAKGGVGKSTVASNLAVALARSGLRVGLLDADIYGPSVAAMFGVEPGGRVPADEEQGMIPVERHGVRLMSMGMFVREGQPLIWRGPMLGKALHQFIDDVAWGQLDYLLLDLPPGTGDVQMTVTMQWAIDGGIIVTTPQKVALADVSRGVRMFKEAGAPVVGVIENMSYHLCPGCGRRTDLFGHGGGRRIAEEEGIAFLGELPLVRSVRQGGDEGRPIVASDPNGEAAAAFARVAERLTLEVPVEEAGHA
ncbi:MAG: MRP family ATP-binding protein [Deltaproteobacteria bacterium]|nr:MAG: MRP family ATP-binding protein [Deltaproteobacteria bacterium]